VVLGNLALGNYTVDISGVHSTAGAYHLEVYLPGDLDGNRQVNLTDGHLLANMLGAQAGSTNYSAAADADLNGVINSADYADWRGNYGDATTINPLTFTAQLASSANTLPGGGFTTNDASIQVAGTTNPSYTVTLVDNGTSVGTFTADAKTGAFTALLTLVAGANSLQAEVSDSFGQQQNVPIQVLLDTQAPVVTISSPASGTQVSSNITITGTVTDIGSGVQTLDASLDNGAAMPVTFDKNGNFSYTTTLAMDGTADGNHTVTFQATDYAGNVSATQSLSFTLTTTPVAQLPTPVLDPASDSGAALGHPGYTNVTSPIVHVTAPTGSGVALLVNGTKDQQTISKDGTATFTLGPLTQGTYSVTAALIASDGSLQETSNALTIHILTTVPAEPVFDLSAASGSNDITTAARVTLVGTTSPGIQVTVVGTGLKASASSSGSFQIPDVELSNGSNLLTVQASDFAGNTSSYSRTIRRNSGNGQPNAVIVWNQAAINAIEADASDPLVASRGLAMVQAAVYDTINAIDGTPAYYVKLTAPTGASASAAVSEAAYTVLTYLYPAQKATFDTLLTQSLAAVPDGDSKTAGITLGQQAGNAIIQLRANDGYNKYVDFTSGTAPGQWQLTPPAYAEPLDPQWATLNPFGMTSPNQFRPNGPPDLTSQQWADALNQVESVGSVTSTTRTADETQSVYFWNDNTGTWTPPGHWNAIAEEVAQQQGDSLADDARLFAELDVSLADAGIAAWDAKYTYDSWRPVTAIRAADTSGNPDVTQDPNWTPLLTTPNFPEYVSGHSTFSAAAATVLDSFFGDNVSFTSTSASYTRTFSGFDQAAQEAGMSRVYGGIHFEFSNVDGQATGNAVATYDLSAFSINQDTTPPRVTLNNVLPSGASNTNVTITGLVTDNLSGVASLQVQVDGGTYAPLSFDSTTGYFSYTTALALNGTADGTHTINFQATDAAGNVATPVPFTFLLGTQAPNLTLSSPTDGGGLSLGTQLTGTANTSGAVALVALNYAFDGGTAMPVAFNSDGSFSQELELSKLAAGNHTLTVTATDAAGNVQSQTLKVNLAAAIPLMVSSLTPGDGSGDVGVTFRPKVVFSRPIDTTTLSSNNFYATDTTGAKILATIVPSDDGTYAWLFFTNPLPSASTITLTVNGSTIRAKDGRLLDAAGNGTPGSELTSTFTTVSTASVPGTTLSGIVADPGPDLKPGTTDDVKPGPDRILGTADDVYLHPIASVEVYILGQENQAVYTDSQGRFSFSSVPVGDVKLVLNGRTAGDGGRESSRSGGILRHGAPWRRRGVRAISSREREPHLRPGRERRASACRCSRFGRVAPRRRRNRRGIVGGG
jgi:hypothetical protein